MNNNRKLKIKKMMKKGATISLCAVLAGGIGVGAYEGINLRCTVRTGGNR